MLGNCESAQERWGGVSDIIDRWLHERQSLLVLFCNLSSQKNAAEDPDETPATLRKFCQILVDYISAGHFEVYQQLIEEGQAFDDQEGLLKAKEHFKVVDATTEGILDFNDKYQETDDLETLLTDLSALGESLETRFEAEDLMIEVLHISHKDQVSESN
jgi:regulator of sigma D